MSAATASTRSGLLREDAVRPGLWRGERFLPARAPSRLAARGAAGAVRRASRRRVLRRGPRASARAQPRRAGTAASRLRRADRRACRAPTRWPRRGGGSTCARWRRGAARVRRGAPDHPRRWRRGAPAGARALRRRCARPGCARSCCGRTGTSRHVCAVSDSADEAEDRFPNLRFRLPEELPTLVAFLARPAGRMPSCTTCSATTTRCARSPGLLGIPHDVNIHDYPWFCPRIALVGADRRYCGEPDIRGCEACIADAGSNLEEEIAVPALVARSARRLRRARRVIAPSADAATRIRAAFPRSAPRGACPGRTTRRCRRRRSPACAPGAIAPGTRRRVLVPAASAREGLRRAARLRARCPGARPAARIRRGRPHERRRAPARDRPRLRHRRLSAKARARR